MWRLFGLFVSHRVVVETAILLEEPYGPEVGMAGGEHCYSRDTSGTLNGLPHITRSPNIRPHVDKKNS